MQYQLHSKSIEDRLETRNEDLGLNFRSPNDKETELEDKSGISKRNQQDINRLRIKVGGDHKRHTSERLVSQDSSSIFDTSEKKRTISGQNISKTLTRMRTTVNALNYNSRGVSPTMRPELQVSE